MILEFISGDRMKREKVLVVNDESRQRKVFVKMLKQSGYGVFEAERPEKVLEYIRKHKIDVVLLDILMPGKAGFKCLEEIQKENSKTPVILMSGADIDNRMIDLLKKGSIAHFRKPILRGKLDRLIKKTLNEANRR